MFVVSITVGSTLEGSDFVVDTFQGAAPARGYPDWLVVPVEQSVAVSLERLAHGVQDGGVGGGGSTTPVVEESVRELCCVSRLWVFLVLIGGRGRPRRTPGAHRGRRC